MKTKIEFKRFFSVDSPKAIKADKYGYLNGINYMSPARSGGVGNLCSHMSKGCEALCLGLESGQASMVSAKTNWTNSVRESRKRKAVYFMHERQAYLAEMFAHIGKLVARAKKLDRKLCVRLNGATDIAYEGLKGPNGLNVFETFPNVQFVDYTKNWTRFNRALPANLHLTFSRSETNEAKALELLARGINVAVVFAEVPATWQGFQVVDGDSHDLRHLDPRGAVGNVIGLSPKGNKAKRDASGFVVR